VYLFCFLYLYRRVGGSRTKFLSTTKGCVEERVLNETGGFFIFLRTLEILVLNNLIGFLSHVCFVLKVFISKIKLNKIKKFVKRNFKSDCIQVLEGINYAVML
jgi:hypothetical protein